MTTTYNKIRDLVDSINVDVNLQFNIDLQYEFGEYDGEQGRMYPYKGEEADKNKDKARDAKNYINDKLYSYFDIYVKDSVRGQDIIKTTGIEIRKNTHSSNGVIVGELTYRLCDEHKERLLIMKKLSHLEDEEPEFLEETYNTLKRKIENISDLEDTIFLEDYINEHLEWLIYKFSMLETIRFQDADTEFKLNAPSYYIKTTAQLASSSIKLQVN